MNKKKADNTSVEVSSKQKKKGRLDGMLESMNKRSDPRTTHKVATKYFSSFRSERNISEPNNSEQKQQVTQKSTAVDSAVSTVVNTKVGTAVIDRQIVDGISDDNDLSKTHSSSENKIYNAIKNELVRNKTEEIRVGLTRLKELTGLSDKTIRVAIKSLEKKKSIEITDTSKGIYGRKYFLPKVQEVFKQRTKAGIQIDQVSKHVLMR